MTGDELRKERKALKLTQEEMAKHVGANSVSTYRNWEQGLSPVPGSVEALLTPRETDAPITFEDLRALEQIAKKRADGSTAISLMREFIKQGIKGALAIALLLTVGYQITNPDHGQARRFGSRRRQESVAIVEVDADAI